MPKSAPYALFWSPDQACYLLRERGDTREATPAGARRISAGDAGEEAAAPAWWREWLAAHTSFAFQGRAGALTLLKEPRARGAGYWYAYRSQDGRTRKRYAGRASDLTPARLEALAANLAAPPQGEKAPEETTEDTEDTEEGQSIVAQVAALARPSAALANSSAIPTSSVPAVLEGPALLAPKLAPPRLRPDLVARERVLARLEAALARKLTVLSTPAGFGKTTLLGQWRAAHASDPAAPAVAWLTLDAEENEPARFWRHVIAACQRIQPGIGQRALARLAAPLPLAPDARPVELALALLLNDLAHLRQPGLLVLDDYHLISDPRIHQSLATLLDHLPPTLRVVLLTRSEPPLPLARWRARDELSELRADDLRLSREETAAFFAQMLPAPLAAEATARLDPHLEGWPAGLRMVARAFERHGGEHGEHLDPRTIDGFLANFAASRQHIREYFITEVLATQSQLTQMFLLRTSVLSRMTGALCEAVAGGDDATRMLARLASANLFLRPLDDAGQWYRYHPLFAEALRQEARARLGEAALRACLRRAAAWFERAGMLDEAVAAALDAGDMPHAAALIEALTDQRDFHAMSGLYAPQGWLERLPAMPSLSSAPQPRALPAPVAAPHEMDDANETAEPLSAAERRVLALLAAGHTRQRIAGELVVSLNTVKTHLQHIYRKLGVSTRAEAIRAARTDPIG